MRWWRDLRPVLAGEPEARADEVGAARAGAQRRVSTFSIAGDDPGATLLRTVGEPVRLADVDVDSPAFDALRAAGVDLVVPLVSSGELIGILNLGGRLSERPYSSYDRRLLSGLAAQAAPALRVAQLLRERERTGREHERIEAELRIAHLIQQRFLPQSLPALPGWEVAAHYQPAREIGGDFYDLIPLGDGRIALVIGDVTDKGVPAALVMASTRSVLRAAAAELGSPGAVLARTNATLCGDIPSTMFVTCLYMVLDPATGSVRYANAGHSLPYLRHDGAAVPLKATGMPLGLLPDAVYDEATAEVAPGDALLLHSDGLVEAHDGSRAMFGNGRLVDLVAGHPGGPTLIAHLLDALAAFTGPDLPQEDDITLLALRRDPATARLEQPAEQRLPGEPRPVG